MHHGFLLRELVRRDLQSRYRGSLLGFLWAFVHPLWQLVLYWIVFSVILKVPLSGERAVSFPVFLFSGLLPWLGFAESLQRSVTTVVDHAGLVRKLRFPSSLLVVACVVSALVHQFVALAIFCAWQAVAGEPVWARAPWLLLGLVAQIALSLGIGWGVAALQVFFRDVSQALGIVLQALFYLTPIVYPASIVPERFRSWLMLNPLATAAQAFRAVLLGSSPPSPAAAWSMIGISLGTLFLGWQLFRRLRPAFADEL
ncbi:MAG: ABC transporter permease [Thermoanaerobaculia bacterium]